MKSLSKMPLEHRKSPLPYPGCSVERSFGWMGVWIWHPAIYMDTTDIRHRFTPPTFEVRVFAVNSFKLLFINNKTWIQQPGCNKTNTKLNECGIFYTVYRIKAQQSYKNSSLSVSLNGNITLLLWKFAIDQYQDLWITILKHFAIILKPAWHYSMHTKT